MAVSPNGVHFIGRRVPSSAKSDPVNGKSTSVSKLDPITGRFMGSYRAVKWKPFEGKFISPKYMASDLFANIKPTQQSIAGKDYGNMTSLCKKYKISPAVAYRWVKKGKLNTILVGTKRFAVKKEFESLAAHHASRKPKKKIKKAVIANAPKKKWWQFWR
jgi:hypothetical protein